MPVYKAPVDDTLFLINDVLGIERYGNLRASRCVRRHGGCHCRGGGAPREEELFPLNHVGDVEGCRRDADGTVHTPNGFKKAYDAYCEGGWLGLAVRRNMAARACPTRCTPRSANT